MPGRRRKKSSKCRKPPLIFSESPVELSKHFASPVSSAANPRTADIISLHDLHCTTWVSPQFDVTGPPSARRRRGRRRGQQTGNIRTACSQGYCATREMVADIGVDEIRGRDQRNARIINDGNTSGDLRDGLKKYQEENDCLCLLSDRSKNNKENSGENVCKCVKEPNNGRTIQSDNCLGIDMSLCSLVETNLSCEEPTSVQKNRTEQAGDMSGSVPRDPLGNVSSDANSIKSQVCHSCTGRCLALAEDTPVHEYNLRVSVRNRRGRLPKIAWDRLMAESLGT